MLRRIFTGRPDMVGAGGPFVIWAGRWEYIISVLLQDGAPQL